MSTPTGTSLDILGVKGNKLVNGQIQKIIANSSSHIIDINKLTIARRMGLKTYGIQAHRKGLSGKV